MSTMTYTGTLAVEECCNCGMMFAIPEDFRARKLRNRSDFYCPAGHPQHFMAETFEATLERERRRAASAEGRASRAEYSRRAVKGHLTRLKNRTANGVCPCCTRTFANLARHMKAKHPGFAGATDD